MGNYNDNMKDIKLVEDQYKDGKNLSQRINIHQNYSVNKEGIGNWLFQQYNFSDGCKVLELGCGTGDMWSGKLNGLPNGIHITLTDFSKGMINETAEKYQAYNFITTVVSKQSGTFVATK